MALSVQTDAGDVANANAYITLAFFKSYHDDRGGNYSAYTDTQIERAIVKATDYLDARWRYRGEKKTSLQTTQWPRWDVEDADGTYIDYIHRAVKTACAEYALASLSGVLMPTPTYDATGRVVSAKTEKVGPIMESVVYERGVGFQLPRYPLADNMLKAANLVFTSGSFQRG